MCIKVASKVFPEHRKSGILRLIELWISSLNLKSGQGVYQKG